MNIEVKIDGKPWCHDINAYINDGEYPPRTIDSEKKFIRRTACQYFLSKEVLYKRNHNTTLLRCIDAPEVNHLMKEMHEGLLRAHANRPLLARKVMGAGYYWLNMESDYIKHVRMWYYCQIYLNRKNVLPQPLHSLLAPWSFSAWGIDVIKPMIPKASNGHEYSLVAIDYLTKWVEATSHKSVTQAVVAQFLK